MTYPTTAASAAPAAPEALRELAEPVGFPRALLQQIRLLAWSRRWVWFLGGVVVLLLFVRWGPMPPEIPNIYITQAIMLLAAAVWAAVVWSGESPRRKSYHWSLPASRAGQDLARVLAGALLLVATTALAAALAGFFEARDGSFDRFAAASFETWANFFVGPLVAYLLFTPLMLWNGYRITGWALAAFGSLAFLAQVLPAADEAITTVFFGEPWGLAGALLTGMARYAVRTMGESAPLEPWWPAAALWLAIAVAFTAFTALWRPDDLKRALRG